MKLLARVMRAAFQSLTAPAVRPPQSDARKRPLDLDQLPLALAESRRVLAPLYARYVESVSSPVWALSLKTAALVHALCSLTRPDAVLDLGSGFSSAVFRLHARASPGCVVHTVDDDPQWLERSRTFLKESGLSDEGLLLWSELGSLRHQYDVILHDMGSMALRAESMGFAFARKAQGGLLVLDDMHKEPYGAFAMKACAEAGLRVVSLRDLTQDAYGRYACLAMDAAP